jgi:hypothetical protein
MAKLDRKTNEAIAGIFREFMAGDCIPTWNGYLTDRSTFTVDEEGFRPIKGSGPGG